MDCELELCSFPDSGNVHVPEDLVHLAFEVNDLEKCMEKLKLGELQSPRVPSNLPTGPGLSLQKILINMKSS